MSDRKKNQYFVPGEGIAREIISADICKYLDNDATVRPGEYQGRLGYFIYAYRNLTTEMIHDLKHDSENYERELREKPKPPKPKDRSDGAGGRVSKVARSNDPVSAYKDSQTYHDRNEYGYAGARDRAEDSPSMSVPAAFGHGRGVPPVDYNRPQGAPYSEQAYVHSPGSGYPPSGQPLPYGYDHVPDQGPPLRGVPPSGYLGQDPSATGYHAPGPASYVDPRDPRNPRSSYAVQAATAPPMPQRYPAPMDPGRYGQDMDRDTRYPPVDSPYGYAGESHPDMRREMDIDPRPDPRVDPKHDPRTGSRPDLHMDTRADLRAGPRDDPRYTNRPDPRVGSRVDQRQYADSRGDQQYYGDNRRRKHN